MCGIIGYVGNQDCLPILTAGLKRLEYRGYDSAGVALMADGKLLIRRSSGKLSRLSRRLKGVPAGVTLGIGHTRWATHGRPSEVNAHPHRAGPVAVVHNGIVENYLQLKQQITSQGCTLSSDTDTELIAHLINQRIGQGSDLVAAVRNALSLVEGYYALAVLSETEPDKLVAVRMGSPLVVGLGQDEYFAASDLLAILNYTNKMVFLDDGELALLSRDGLKVMDIDRQIRKKEVHQVPINPALAEKGRHKHFMQKEIYEQPWAVTNTLRGRISVGTGEVMLSEIKITKKRVHGLAKVFLVACGTSYHAALVGKFMLEKLARIPTEVDIASEFRYRDPIIGKDDLLVLISQSGETADTLAAAREGRAKGSELLAIVNVERSSLARMADHLLLTHAGPEVGVASTKAFVTQITALYLLALFLASRRGVLSLEQLKEHIDNLVGIPALMEKVLLLDHKLEDLARRYTHCKDFLYLGRGINYPIALEGALKLKEISYVHAEGYPAGEMKHGPIALIDGAMPVVVLATKGPSYEKVMSNIEEVKARDGVVIAFASAGDDGLASRVDHIFFLPQASELVTPIILTVPLQLLAYHVARLKGTDVDQPRNLAKSVTVE